MRGIPFIGNSGRPRTRRAVASAVTLAAALGLAACGTSGPSTTASAKGLTMWALNDQTILKDSVDAYNKDHPDEKITLRLFANDDYKQKLRVAFGANQAPDIFFSWGGGALDDYVKAGKVDALTDAQAGTDRFTPSVMQSATFDGKVYGVPANGLAPVVLYYNKKVLKDAGVEPPKTYDDLLAAVKKLKAKGVVPLSLAANSKWPTLMYLEYLLDRAGGSRVFSKIASGDASRWKDPSVTKANQYLQDLAKTRIWSARSGRHTSPVCRAPGCTPPSSTSPATPPPWAAATTPPCTWAAGSSSTSSCRPSNGSSPRAWARS
ncbi:ABC transporter, substrate-binding protein [Streptomyces ipomoeae 91-03]|uniref:ABC transporter, substrate-binding protein n=1 Tax=Streptomyces ipomoeae 91-03 TaxID=698759 RepID=L1KPF0_9ACTN|nr:ABC transporter, substrate-binding protein [Streptomyces ipomoeae 91-03]